MAEKYPSGAVQVAMLRKLMEDNPKGESGFRQNEISQAAVKKKWVRWTFESGRVTWYEITPEGREAWAFGKSAGKY